MLLFSEQMLYITCVFLKNCLGEYGVRTNLVGKNIARKNVRTKVIIKVICTTF